MVKKTIDISVFLSVSIRNTKIIFNTYICNKI